MSEVIISIKDVKVHYPVKVRKKLGTVKKVVKAVDGVTLDIYKNETLGIVGESGCGKSTLCRSIIGLEKLTAGSIAIEGRALESLDKQERFAFRRKIQMIFQDAYSTLDPRFTIGKSIAEPMRIHKQGDRESQRARVLQLLQEVGLPESYIDRFPHEFSGGQRQRIGVARALALNPSIILCDEPVSALDVSIQSQILNLMKDLQEKHDLTYVFVSHNLSVVKHLCHRIAVMYLGTVVELARSEELYQDARHPYTQALLSAIPVPDPDYQSEVQVLEGDVPSPMNPPQGCPFVTRCPYAQEQCRQERPALKDLGGGHMVACHRM